MDFSRFFRHRPALYLGLIMLLLLPILVHAQDTPLLAPPEITGEAIYIPFPVNITLDGDLADWEGVPRTIVNRGTMTSTTFGENNSFSVSAAADTANLYVLMTMPDANIVTGQHGTDFWNEDSMEFYANFSGDLNAQSYGDGIFQININPGDIGNSDPTALTITGSNSAASGVQGIVFKTANGWGFEASVPLPAAPVHGAEIGFQAQVNGATQTDRDVKLIWSLADTSDSSWQNPSLFGRGIFFEIGQQDIPALTASTTAAVVVVPTSQTQEDTTVQGRAITAVNQVGYFVGSPKIAVYGRADAAATPPTWELRNAADGARVMSGSTTGGDLDANSGDYVYRADFSIVNTPGQYILSVDGVDSQPFQIGVDLYKGLKRDALRYFYLNRSGIELTPESAGAEWARPAGHLSDRSVTCLKDGSAGGKPAQGCDYHLDGSGGWYDAGDYGKYVVNGGISLWTLMNLYERIPSAFPGDGLNIYESDNSWPDIMDETRWEMDFMLRMQVPEGQPLAGMAHHKLHDRHWTGVPIMPPTEINSDDPNSGRFLMPPSTAATLNLAASAAQCARIWRTFDDAFAARCLKAAETAWTAAQTHPDMLYGNNPGDDGGGNYGDDNVQDEFYWAAAELYLTTGKAEYRDFVTASPYYQNFANALPINWGSTAALGSISLVTVSNDLPADDLSRLRDQIVTAADDYLATSKSEGYHAPIKANDYVWGSNSVVLNNAIVLALAYDFTQDTSYLNVVLASMDYILGENAVNQSFVSGYGTVSMEHPHHRFWGNNPAQGFPPPPPGAISGGPNGSPADPTAISAVKDLPISRRYIDNIGSYSTNEVAINWNAPLVWVAAYLDNHFNGS